MSNIEKQQIINQVESFIRLEIIGDDSFHFSTDCNLLEMGVIDSLSMIRLFDYTNHQFAANIPDAELSPDNFESVNAIANIIWQYLDSKAA